MGPSEVQVSWSPWASLSAAPVDGFDVAPLVGGVPCPTCAGANSVGPGTASLVLGTPAGASTTYAVRPRGPGGTSAWVPAQLPGAVARPAAARPAATSPPGGGPLVATQLAGTPTSALDTPPAGFSRTVIRDGGFSALTASDGDLWSFGDTTVLDSPVSGDSTGAVTCLTANGTAAVGPPSLPLQLAEAVQPASAAVAAGSAQCSVPATLLPAGAQEPYQLLRSSQGSGPGISCSNWVSGLADQASGTGQATNEVLASYGANCFGPKDELVGLGGMWTSPYRLTSPGAQAITLPPGDPSSPDLPTASCPAEDVTSYDGGGSAMIGNYGSVVATGGFDYFFSPYGNSTDAFVGLGIPEATCSSMGLARVPEGTDPSGTPYAAVPADYQYLLPGGRWVSPGSSGQSAAELAAESADIMPADYGGAYGGQVDVAALADGELVMVYLLPSPVLDPAGGIDVAAIRTASSPAGPWSVPAPFEMPWAGWGNDYQLVLHPELSGGGALTLSYVAVSDLGTLIDRQVGLAAG